MAGKRVYDKKLPNKLPEVLSALDPYRDRLKGVVIESTYNWYWLVDGLMDKGYPVLLANPAGMEPNTGMSTMRLRSLASGEVRRRERALPVSDSMSPFFLSASK